MIPFLPVRILLGIGTGLLLGLNTLIAFSLMVPAALLKLATRRGGMRAACDKVLNGLAAGWVAVNNAWISVVCPVPWQVNGVGGLHRRGWYLVSSNHQSWVDILVLQRVFHGRIPFIKFFLKKQLFWVPVIGLAWWALDFPFMARGSGPGAKRKDLAITRKACEKFRQMPTTVMNFVEGTRFTPAKHARQPGAYRHLLEPKIGGLGVALASMGELFDAMLDVTIVYPDGVPSLWSLLCGNAGAVLVDVQQCVIPPEVTGVDTLGDKPSRERVRQWINVQWAAKDRLIDRLLTDLGTVQ